MNKGYDKHQHRHDTLSQFGKDLARRSSSRCELCDSANVALRVHEIPPIHHEAKFEHCIFICDHCKEQIEKPKKRDANYLRCLNRSAWSETAAVQVAALSLLQELIDEDWARELLEQVYIIPEIADWLQKVKQSH